ncbi:phosphomannomutase/phosphoglucomutase [Parapusillimonas granuli]|uniref:Phosphomannomutase/phosphoglucomutase n=1 Tax=Parapusillimonas granuli TaxID=380911 RepID=A0A853FZS7_9BURK|nr:phosphomannomutase/phosphoglucomutase [Parapusillimonas granuli]MEB2398423.1 phosphomannomutase/phosphoglucomutase [Alcaligenaceae bacterium]NYT49559.1 phosphomannomutase/phosphoglucomutase [Parapusillimonas granuli]
MTTSPPLPTAVFKAYDIRGIVPDQLNPDFAHALGLALAQRARAEGVEAMVVGYDGRHSSPGLAEGLQKGLLAGGIDTIDLGMVPTPLVYFAAHTQHTGSGVAITGSHNPPAYNGFKMMLGGKTLFGDGIQQLRAIMENLDPIDGIAPGTRRELNLLDAYVQYISSTIKLARPMKIAIDCGNGVGGVVARRLYESLGCTVDPLFCEVDGNFPNHHPDPADPHNLQDLIRHVQESDCELGLAFDGDADRLGVVTKSGEIIWPDRQLILYARDVLKREPGATIIFDVKCSRHVARAIKQASGRPVMWQTGHSMIKAKLAETGAPLAGEMSGHIFFKERWFGFDDGLYTGARLLEILSEHENPSAVLEDLPQDISTPEIKLEMSEGEPHALIERLQNEGKFPSASSISTIDGVRAEYADGFGLARASNTTPVVVLRFEGDSPEDLERIKAEFRAALVAVAPGITLPF